MRVWKTLAVTALILGMSLAPQAQAQQAGNAAPQAARSISPTRMRLIDVAFIFDKHPTLKQQIEGIDEQAKKALELLNSRREEVLKQFESLRQYKEGSPEYKKAEEQVANLKSSLELEFSRKEREFQELKAKVIYDTYVQIQGAIKQFADYNGIDIVLRFSREEMDPKKPVTVSQGINRNIVYYQNDLDMTNNVLDFLNQQLASSVSRPQSPINTATQPTGGAPKR